MGTIQSLEVTSFADRVKGNPYPGRGIVMGMTKDGTRAAVAYFIMGRSENSQNRVFIMEGNDLVIRPHDPKKVKNPELIIYHPIRTLDEGKTLVVTNGDQTDTIVEKHKTVPVFSGGFEQALNTRKFEPDKPNYTPRISAVMDLDPATPLRYKMSILKAGDRAGKTCSRYYFNYEAEPGVGHFIHTYQNNGNPIPSFFGEPERISIPNELMQFAYDIRDSLNEEFLVALYVRVIDLKKCDFGDIVMNKWE